MSNLRFTLDALKQFAEELGAVEGLLVGDEESGYWQCENGDVIGFQGAPQGLLCYLQRSYDPFVLDSLWAPLFTFVNEEDWQAYIWHIGLASSNHLVMFTWLSPVGLSAEHLHQLFSEIWRLRSALDEL